MAQDNLNENETVLIDGDKATLVADDSKAEYLRDYYVRYDKGAVREEEEYGDERDAVLAFGIRELEPMEPRVPLGVAREGSDAIAAWLLLQAKEDGVYDENAEVAESMELGKRSVSTYISRFKKSVEEEHDADL